MRSGEVSAMRRIDADHGVESRTLSRMQHATASAPNRAYAVAFRNAAIAPAESLMYAHITAQFKARGATRTIAQSTTRLTRAGARLLQRLRNRPEARLHHRSLVRRSAGVECRATRRPAHARSHAPWSRYVALRSTHCVPRGVGRMPAPGGVRVTTRECAPGLGRCDGRFHAR